MDADLIRTVATLGCLATAAHALYVVVRRRATWMTAAAVACAASVWSILTGQPFVVYMVGAVVALTCAVFELNDEDAEIEAMQS